MNVDSLIAFVSLTPLFELMSSGVSPTRPAAKKIHYSSVRVVFCWRRSSGDSHQRLHNSEGSSASVLLVFCCATIAGVAACLAVRCLTRYWQTRLSHPCNIFSYLQGHLEWFSVSLVGLLTLSFYPVRGGLSECLQFWVVFVYHQLLFFLLRYIYFFFNLVAALQSLVYSTASLLVSSFPPVFYLEHMLLAPPYWCTHFNLHISLLLLLTNAPCALATRKHRFFLPVSCTVSWY